MENVTVNTAAAGEKDEAAKEIERKVIQLYLDGYKITDICTECSLGTTGIYRILKNNGITFRKPRIDNEKAKEVRDLRINEGMTIAQICKELRMSPNTVVEILKGDGTKRQKKAKKK